MKLKTKVKKSLSKFKEYLQDQWFYAKRLARQAVQFSLEVTAATLKIAFFAVCFSLAFLFVEKAHIKYVENKVESNVLLIRSAPDSAVQGSATGFEVIAPSGKIYTLTNAHVCALKNKDNNVMVQEKLNSGRFIPRRVIEVYEENDLCLVEGVPGYTGLTIGTERELRDPVISIGYPLGGPLHISSGRVKAFGKVWIMAQDILPSQCKGERLRLQKINVLFFEMEMCMRSYESIETDLVTFPGNSGSPVVDMWGNVVGVIFASHQLTHWGHAVPLKDVNKLLRAY